ncbi:MAG: hypothetical protein FJW30_09325 [Acidobacteria bacterium]|nr:hypothetical protein [Acidobacteriota bacterium]
MRLDALPAFLIGAFFFLLNHTAAISGAMAPPPGHVPTNFVTCADVPMYLSWIELARTHWLLPNPHMPQITEPALFHPLIVLTGRMANLLGLTAGQAYYVTAFLLHWACAAAWLWMLRIFCPTAGQRWAAAAIALCAVPVKLLALPAAKLAGLPAGIFALGMIEYAVETGDGFARGGLGLGFGTGTLGTLLTISLGALYLRGEGVRNWLLFTIFLNALLHPFEPVLTIPLLGLAVLLFRRERIWDLPLFAAAGLLGVAPYVWTTLTTPWLAAMARHNSWEAPWPGWVFMAYGVPAIAVVYLLMVRAKLQDPVDRTLLIWYVLPIALMYVPFVPFALHLFNGYAYMLGTLVVRLWVNHKKLSRVTPGFGAAAFAAVPAAALVMLYAQLANDGRAAEPELLTSSVRKAETAQLLQWIGSGTRPGDLVLAPEELAPWLPVLLRRAPASHDIASGATFASARKDLQALYIEASPDQVPVILRKYSPDFVIAPDQSVAGLWLARNATRAFQAGATSVYKLTP